jgi:hypothetical protein
MHQAIPDSAVSYTGKLVKHTEVDTETSVMEEVQKTITVEEVKTVTKRLCFLCFTERVVVAVPQVVTEKVLKVTPSKESRFYLDKASSFKLFLVVLFIFF